MEEYEPPQVNQTSMSVQPNRDENFSRWRLDSTEVINNICVSLKGDTWDYKEQKYVPSGLPSIVNDRGVREIKLMLETYLNPITLTTDLTEESITHITRRLGEELALLFALYPREIGLDTKTRGILHKKLTDQVYFSLRKSKDAGERKSVTDSYQLIEREREPKNKPIWG